MGCHLVVVITLEFLNDPKSCTVWDFSPGRLNHAGLVEGLRPDKEQSLVLEVGGWAVGQSLAPVKQSRLKKA